MDQERTRRVARLFHAALERESEARPRQGKKTRHGRLANAAISLSWRISCLLDYRRGGLGGLRGRISATFPLASISIGLPIFVAPPVITVLSEGG